MTIRTFRAGPNGITMQIGIAHQQYVPIQARTDFSYTPSPGQTVSGYDDGGEWNNTTFTWTPQAGPISWDAEAWAFNFGAPANVAQNLVVSVFKNGVDFYAAVGGELVNTFSATGSDENHGMDNASGSDTYQFMVFMTTPTGGATGELDPDPRHVYIVGRSFGGL